jgi:hypothetical protein
MQRPDFTCRVNSTLSVDSFNQRPVRQAYWAHRAETIFFADGSFGSVTANQVPLESPRRHGSNGVIFV